MGCDSEGCEVGRCNYEGKPLVIAKSDKERIAELERQLADEELAFNHANETIGKLEDDLADARKAAEKIHDLADSQLPVSVGNQWAWARVLDWTRPITAPPEPQSKEARK